MFDLISQRTACDVTTTELQQRPGASCFPHYATRFRFRRSNSIKYVGPCLTSVPTTLPPRQCLRFLMDDHKTFKSDLMGRRYFFSFLVNDFASAKKRCKMRDNGTHVTTAVGLHSGQFVNAIRPILLCGALCSSMYSGSSYSTRATCVWSVYTKGKIKHSILQLPSTQNCTTFRDGNEERYLAVSLLPELINE